ncbi:MAG: regulatory protein RecX [Candidatus Choladocola sp.]|nr:regulatory protein RecX [Candidatus Choladocola sp.]
MRQIDEIRKLTGGRYLVCLEDGTRFPLYEKELEEFRIRQNEELSESDFQKIMEELLPKRAKLKAMHLLKNMDRTEMQLRTRLKNLDYPETVTEEAIAYVKQYRYIDDLRYASNYMEYRKERYSVRQMEQELLQKGIEKEIIDQALEQTELPDEESQIARWLEKKHYSPETADQKETERMYRFLLRKGYKNSAIQRMMRGKDLYE